MRVVSIHVCVVSTIIMVGVATCNHNGYRVFRGGKVRPGRAADHSPPSSAEVLKGWSYTSTPPSGPQTGL